MNGYDRHTAREINRLRDAASRSRRSHHVALSLTAVLASVCAVISVAMLVVVQRDTGAVFDAMAAVMHPSRASMANTVSDAHTIDLDPLPAFNQPYIRTQSWSYNPADHSVIADVVVQRHTADKDAALTVWLLTPGAPGGHQVNVAGLTYRAKALPPFYHPYWKDSQGRKVMDLTYSLACYATGVPHARGWTTCNGIVYIAGIAADSLATVLLGTGSDEFQRPVQVVSTTSLAPNRRTSTCALVYCH